MCISDRNTGHKANTGAAAKERRIIIRAMLRLVLDTNVVLDLFHWANTDAVPIMAALEAGQIECFADDRTLDELQRVLTYPQLKMTPEMIVERYARYSGTVSYTHLDVYKRQVQHQIHGKATVDHRKWCN